MIETMTPEEFLSQYDPQVSGIAMKLRKMLHNNLPGIIEQVDIPARMIGYCYSQKYVDLICSIFPSKKGLKLSFNRGRELPDPHNQLEGTGKISRYVIIKSVEQVYSPELKTLLSEALAAWRKATKNR